MKSKAHKVNSRIMKSILAIMFAFVAVSSVVVQAASKDTNSKEINTNIDYMFHNIAQKITVLLQTEPEFLPFGAGMDLNGKVQYIWTDKKQKYTAEGAMLLVRQALKSNADAGRLISVATIYRYGRPDKAGKVVEQVNVELEYANGYSVVRAIELITGKDGEVTVGKAAEGAMDAKIFTPEIVDKLLKK